MKKKLLRKVVVEDPGFQTARSPRKEMRGWND
jgi:hypothetical protein